MKSILFLIFSITFLLFVSGCTVPATTQSDGDPCSYTEGRTKDICYLKTAEKEGDQSYCNSIASSDLKARCLGNQAQATSQTQTGSETTPTPILPPSGATDITQDVLEDNADIILAECLTNMPGISADDCYSIHAPLKNDPNLCNLISDTNSKDLCYSAIASRLSDETICSRIGDGYSKDSCYSYIAVTKQEKSICNLISDEFDRSTCNDLIQ